MAVTEDLVKFAYGKKANYKAAEHSNYVYFATDTPLIHTKGMWRGVSKVILDSSNMLHITTAEKDSDNNNTVATEVKVDLTSIACTATQRSQWTTAYNFVKSITDDTNEPDNIINKWEEIVEFLRGIGDDTLNNLMSKKADKATKVFGFNGIKITKTNASGDVQEGDATLGSSFQVAIASQVTTGAGTYTKVTVNDAGLVTAGQSLVESDLPSISIGKISGLQAALNDKLTGSSEIGTLAPLSGGGPLNEEPTISLNYDNATLVVDSSTGKLKVGTIAQNQVSGLSTTLAGYVPTSRTISAGVGLTGGGNLTANRTLSVKAADESVNVSSSGVKVVSAPKLTTAQTLWGNSFDGTASISGDIKFYDALTTTYTGRGMRLSGANSFIGFSNILGDVANGVKAFAGITLGWGATPETEVNSVRISDDTFTYKGHPIYYKGLAQFTTDVNSLIKAALKPMATDFTALTNRVTDVEKQLKWIEVTN